MKRNNIPDNYVAMEQLVCPVCGTTHDSGAILLNQRLRSIKGAKGGRVTTGYGLCDEHQRLFDEGYLALIGIDPSRSSLTGDTVKTEGAYRTGTVMHIRRTVADAIFNIPIDPSLPMVFVDENVLVELEARAIADGALPPPGER